MATIRIATPVRKKAGRSNSWWEAPCWKLPQPPIARCARRKLFLHLQGSILALWRWANGPLPLYYVRPHFVLYYLA